MCAAVFAPLAACDRQVDPPPLHAGEPGHGLLPVTIPDLSADRGLLAPAAASDAPRAAHHAGGLPATEAVHVDDSTPEGVLDGYIRLLAAGGFQQLPELMVPDQQETARQLLGTVGPLMQAQAELARVVDERFPGHAIQLGQGMDGLAGFAEMVTVVDVQVNTEDQAEATLSIAATGDQERVKLERVGGQWRVRDPRIEQIADANLDQMVAMMNAMTRAMLDVAARVESGEIADEQALNSAMMELVSAMMLEMEGQMEQMDWPPQEQSPVDLEHAPPPRQREAVDDAFIGPGHLRRN